MKIQRHSLLFWSIPIIAIILDQVTKLSVEANFIYRERINIIPNFFDLTLVYNPGAAFSFLANENGWQKYFFTVLAFGISAFLVYSIIKQQFGKLGSLGAVMIIGGAMGNVIDRFLHGHVIDFLLFYYKSYYYPAFNVADCFICIGAGLIILDGFITKKSTQEQK